MMVDRLLLPRQGKKPDVLGVGVEPDKLLTRRPADPVVNAAVLLS